MVFSRAGSYLIRLGGALIVGASVVAAAHRKRLSLFRKDDARRASDVNSRYHVDQAEAVA